MQFIALLICLVLERWTQFGQKARSFDLFQHYIHLIHRLLSKQKLNAYVLLAFYLVPLLLIVLIIYLVLASFAYGFFAFLFSIFILIYALGSFDFHLNAEPSQLEDESERKKHIAAIFLQGNRNLFALIFWFAVLGPIGAVLYRLTHLVSRDENLTLIHEKSLLLQQILDWIPVRLMALSSALVSHFIAVIKAWLSVVITGISQNEKVLAECGYVAFGEDEVEEKAEIEDVKEKVKLLIERALIVWLVILALLILL